MGRARNEVITGRWVRCINLPTQHVILACELMLSTEFEGEKYGRGYYAIMDGEKIKKVVDFKTFRQAYLPICTWLEYDAGWNEGDE